MKTVRETVALLLFFGAKGGCRRKLLNLAGEQEVNPFCLPLKEKKTTENEGRASGQNVEIELCIGFGIQTELMEKRQRHALEERQKIKYKASSPGCVTENILVMSCFQQAAAWGCPEGNISSSSSPARSFCLTEDVSWPLIR